MINIAIFASGSGSNAENIMAYFKDHSSISVGLILSNKEDAGVFKRAEKFDKTCLYLSKSDFNNPEKLLALLKKNNIDFIVLAGFLLLVPTFLVNAYSNKIINLHPARLPKFGGKGMYGKHVHQEVLEAKEKISGITVHYVNSEYDKGDVIFQSEFDILPDYEIEDLEKRIHEDEYAFFPKVIEKTIKTEFNLL